MKIFVLIPLSFLLLGSMMAQSPPVPSYEQIIINSAKLSGPLPVQVHLPADYDMNAEKYQVHYVLDGMLASRMYAGIADHYAQLNLMPEIIVIGVNMNRRYGQADFCGFLEEELIPYIDSTYRILPFRLLAGHSSSAELTLYELYQGAGKINAFVAGSPTGLEKFIVRRDSIIDPDIRFVYTSVAENDFKDIREQYPVFFEMAEKQFPGDLFHGAVITGLSHHTCFPVVVNNALLQLFEGWLFTVPEGHDDQILTAIENHCQVLSKRFGYPVQLPEKTIFRMAYQWIYQKNKYEQAIDLLTYGLQQYPGSGFLYHLQGKAHQRSGKYKLAQEFYLEAIRREPDYQRAQEDYELLKKEINEK